MPLTQEHLPAATLFVPTADDPAALLPLIADRVTAVDAGVTITRAITLGRLLSESLVRLP